MTVATVLTRLRIRNADDDADQLVVTSEPGGTNPYIADAEVRADGQTLNPLTGAVSVGDYVIPVIDAVGTTTQEVIVWQSDFGIFADTAAFDAFWTVDDDAENLMAFAIDTTHLNGASKAVKVSTTGASASASGIHAQRGYGLTGLEPDTTYHVYRRIYDTGRWPSLTDGTWSMYQAADVVSNSSGNAVVYIGWITSGSGVPDTDDHWEGDLWITVDQQLDAPIVTATLGDVNGRLAVLGHRAIYETNVDGAGWTTLVDGFLTEAELVDGLRWDMHVGDANRVEQTATLFQSIDRTYTEPSCLLGGPVVGGFAIIADHGKPTFRVSAVTAGKSVDLTYVSGAMPPTWSTALDSSSAIGILNGFSAQLAVPSQTYVANARYYVFPDLGVELWEDGTQVTEVGAERAVAGIFTPISRVTGPGSVESAFREIATSSMSFAIDWAANQPSVGDRFQVLLYGLRCSTLMPFHVSGHPVTVAAAILSALGVAVDSTSVTTTRNALGTAMWVDLRVTDPILAATALQDWLYGPFGFACRVGTDGERELVPTRYRASSDPSETISLSSLRGLPANVWRVSESSICNKLIWTQDKYRRAVLGSSDATTPNRWPMDGLDRALYTLEVTSAEDAADTGKPCVVAYTIPGQVGHPAQGGVVFDVSAWVNAMATHLFTLFGRGCPEQALACLRGVDAQVGDYAIVNVAHLPVTIWGQSPSTQRGGAKVIQVVQRTENPAGPDLVVWDAGAVKAGSANPLVPTLTIVASSAYPTKMARITVTNAAAIETAHYHVRIEYGVGGSEPSGWLLLGYVDPDGLTYLDTPLLNVGAHVWARARLERASEGGRTVLGVYSSVVDVTLDSLTAPSSLTATAQSDLVALLEWTNGEAEVPVVVEWKVIGDAVWTRAAKLDPGSVQLLLGYPDTAVNYTNQVYHEENEPYYGVSSAVSVNFTTGASPAALSPPTDPVAAAADGVCTLAVTAGSVASLVWEFAIEDSPGAGTFGAYTVYRVYFITYVGQRITAEQKAMNDGRLRRLRARHEQAGYDPSAYTAVQDVDPWPGAA